MKVTGEELNKCACVARCISVRIYNAIVAKAMEEIGGMK